MRSAQRAPLAATASMLGSARDRLVEQRKREHATDVGSTDGGRQVAVPVEERSGQALVAELARRGLVRRDNSHTSRHKGVCWHKGTKTWQAQIKRDGKTEHLGAFATEAEAKACLYLYDVRCLELGLDPDAGMSSDFRGVGWHKATHKWNAQALLEMQTYAKDRLAKGLLTLDERQILVEVCWAADHGVIHGSPEAALIAAPTPLQKSQYDSAIVRWWAGDHHTQGKRFRGLSEKWTPGGSKKI